MKRKIVTSIAAAGLLITAISGFTATRGFTPSSPAPHLGNLVFPGHATRRGDPRSRRSDRNTDRRRQTAERDRLRTRMHQGKSPVD